MEVRDGMSGVVLTVGPGHTLREAARKMTEREVGAAVVIDDELPAPGVLRERDILNSLGKRRGSRLRARRRPLLRPVITASPDWSLERAAMEMSRRHIRHLVVVDGGELVGVLSMRDIMRVWTSDGATSSMTSPESESAPARAAVAT